MTLPAGGIATFQAPNISPAYLGVGYIIGPSWARSTLPAACSPGACSCRC